MKRLRVVAGKMAFLRGTARAVCVFVFLSGVVTPLVLLLLVSNNTPDLGERWGGGRGILSRTPHERRPLDYVDTRGVEELQFQIHELEEIRASVRNELRVMDQSRIKLGREVDTLREALTRTKKELGMTKMELQDAKGKLSRASRESGRVLDMPRQTTSSPAPIVILPMQQKLPDLADIPSVSILPSEEQYSKCTYPLCFDFSKCPLTQPFFVFVYNQHFRNLFNLEHPEIVDSFVSSLHHKHSLTSDSSKACVFVAVIGPLALPLPTADEIETKLHSLPHWDKDGVNHVLIHLSTIEQTRSVLNNVATGRAVVVQNHLSTKRTFRKDFDILSPPITFTESNEPFWEGLPPHVPSWRTNLLYFQGKQVVTKGTSTVYPISAAELDSLRDALVSNNAKVVIETDCPEGVAASNALEGEWALCGTEQHRSSTCSKSTFSLSLGNGIEVGSTTYTRLIESLKCGAVPVVFGISVLPFDDVIDWRKAAILLPPGRFGDIHYIVRSMEADTILEYRRQGRFIWETFLRSPGRILDSIISIVRYKSLHPPPPALEYSGRRLITTSGNIPSIPSPTFQHNFSTYTNNFWNAPPGPFWMYPVTPFQPGPVSGTKYTGMDASTILHLPLHIVQAGGITGPHFESYLLGNSAEEQFTVVMLTYHRNEVLLEAVERLKELSFLAKVVVVWNTEDDPPTDMGWPSIGVPVEVGASLVPRPPHGLGMRPGQCLLSSTLCLWCPSDSIPPETY